MFSGFLFWGKKVTEEIDRLRVVFEFFLPEIGTISVKNFLEIRF